ncbi:MAG: DNA methyltransferase [Myxococcota bacterium]
MTFDKLISMWSVSGSSERANKDGFLRDLCDALGVTRPDPTTGDPILDQYVFEADAKVPHEGGAVTIGKMDLYKAQCFVLEAKQGSKAGSGKVGTARRETPTWSNEMHKAYGQAVAYARSLDAPPPFLIVCDIGHCFDVYATFEGGMDYRPFPDGQASRIFLQDIEKNADRLRAIWTDPHSLDPAKVKAKVTHDIAELIAVLAASLQADGHEPELVAKFLMRCLFTMFAEDVELLRTDVFTDALSNDWIPDPSRFEPEVSALWDVMNRGGTLFGVGKILRFNGGLFADARAIPLTRKQLQVLHSAAKCEWSNVEPAIFGTLLERALSEKERHRLGAHYTPRAYVERLVKPTIEEPLRARWDLVRVEARQHVEAGRIDAARAAVGAFHGELCRTRVLDPACGTGNFLYVALDTFKRLESEVIALLHDLGDDQTMFGLRVTPSQFLGIEKKPWAKEIAELVLWMGYLSWNARIYGKAGAAREPILADYGHIECRDAVLAWDRIEPVLDAEDNPVTRWDGETTKVSPVTGNEVPDDSARVPVVRYVNPTRAPWPPAEYVVGNPPFIGNKRMREALGEGYTEALRAVYPEETSTADFVMFWWHKAADRLSAKAIRRFGFITTNSITQVFNRKVIEAHVGDGKLAIVWAVADHPWVLDGAAVRIAMTVATNPGEGREEAVLERVTDERETGAQAPSVTLERRVVGQIHPDLRGGANVAGAVRLRSNMGLSFQGMNLVGEGFRLTPEEVVSLGYNLEGLPPAIRPYLNARDLTQSGAPRYVIDFYGLSAEEAAVAYPAAYQWVLVHVKPERDENKRDSRRTNWWLFGETVGRLRAAWQGLDRFIVTPKTAKHRPFVFLPSGIIPDGKLYTFAMVDAYCLGALSAKPHLVWALASGGFLEDRPTYNNLSCFEPFPFPDATPAQRVNIALIGERLDAHRKARQAAHPDVTLTGMYNVLEKVRAGGPLNDKERAIHDKGLVSLLLEIHGQLDAAVAQAYGWPADLPDEEILTRLVALNAERAAEEKRGLIRWLRPDYQRPLAGVAEPENQPLPGLEVADVGADGPEADVKLKWPPTLTERISAVRAAVLRAPVAVGVEEVARGFAKAPRKDVIEILDSLAALGIVLALDTAAGRRWRAMQRAAA